MFDVGVTKIGSLLPVVMGLLKIWRCMSLSGSVTSLRIVLDLNRRECWNCLLSRVTFWFSNPFWFMPCGALQNCYHLDEDNSGVASRSLGML